MNSLLNNNKYMFFKKIREKLQDFDLTIVLRKKDDQITVSVTPKSNSENAKIKFDPFIATGTAEELDAEFFNHMDPALDIATGLKSNLEEFKASAEKKTEKKIDSVKKELAPKEESKKKEPAKTKEAIARDKKFLVELEKCNKLFADKKYRTAHAAYEKLLSIVPKEHTEDLEQKIAACKKAFEQVELPDKEQQKVVLARNVVNAIPEELKQQPLTTDEAFPVAVEDNAWEESSPFKEDADINKTAVDTEAKQESADDDW